MLIAIQKTLEKINCSERQKQAIKNGFKRSALLNLQTRYNCLKLHKEITKLCTKLKNKNKGDVEQKKLITQLEVLSKRFIDIHYKKIKKVSSLEAVINDISRISSSIGLVAGVIAATLIFVGFFVPPVMPFGFIAGYVGLLAYTGSLICNTKMIIEAWKFKRAPSSGDFNSMLADIVFAPGLAGGAIFASITNAVRDIKILLDIVKMIKNIWNVLSNLFPTILSAKNISIDLLKVGGTFSDVGQSKNTTSATSWSHMASALAKDDPDALDTIKQAKKEIVELNTHRARPKPCELQKKNFQQLQELADSISSESEMKTIKDAMDDYLQFNAVCTEKYLLPTDYEKEVTNKNIKLDAIKKACEDFSKSPRSLNAIETINKIKRVICDIGTGLFAKDYKAFNKTQSIATALHGRDFAYTTINKGITPLVVNKSYHAHILFWDKGFRGTTTSKEAQAVKKAVEQYRNLAPDTNKNVRHTGLEHIQKQCTTYLETYKSKRESKGRYSFVEKLLANVTRELDNLHDFGPTNEKNNEDTWVLIEFKAKGN